MRKYLAYQPEGSSDALDAFWEMEISRTSLTIIRGSHGTVGHTVVEHFNTEDACHNAAMRHIHDQERKNYTFIGGARLQPHKLPAALADDLVSTTQYPNGVMCYAHADIRHITVVIDHQRPDRQAYSEQQENIYEKEKGLFCTTAYVVAAARTGEKMVWLPELNSYGMWLEKQRQLYLFVGHTWDLIRKDIAGYFVQYRLYPDILNHIKVWEWFDFIPASLAGEATQILALTDDTRPAEAEAFIRLYEERLLQHPFCAALEEAFRAMVTLYNYMGQRQEEKAEYANAVGWLEKAVLIIHQSAEYRTRVFIHTFLQLSFCHLEISSFEGARQYIDTYQLYDPTAAEECAQIRNSIGTIQKVYNEAMDVYEQTLHGGTPRQYALAIEVTMQALQYAPNDPVLHFNLACFYAVLKQIKKSLHYLDLAFRKGFQNEAKIFNDHDLENVRTTREFTDMFIHYFGPQKK